MGMFGILGVSGALFAPFAGKICDKKSAKYTVGINIIIILNGMGFAVSELLHR